MKTKITSILFALTLLLSSCYSSNFVVGEMEPKQKQETYDKSKQMWVFWGLINISDGQANTPRTGNYIITTKTKFVDILATGLTFGVFSMRSVTIKTDKNESEL